MLVSFLIIVQYWFIKPRIGRAICSLVCDQIQIFDCQGLEDPKADRYLPWPATNLRSSGSRSKKAINCGWMVCYFDVVLFTEVVQVDQFPFPEVRPFSL